ncbi:WhiB family transcriptional regulator [Streptomyces griseus]|uniref:WhiB family transcriptional regulator n=1 Tax=Streptomyces griseus TaxID=1911 RepID=UPI000B2ECF4B|nr:WhiB family transcriptional regulator [Streptomyces griseus]
MSQPDPTPWQAAAACAGLSPSVVFARRERQAAPALRACASCPVRRECAEAVAPAESWFDGVCAGLLWRNGRPVKPRSSRTSRSSGTSATASGAPGARQTAGGPLRSPADPFDARAVAAQLDAVLAGAGSGAGTRGGGRG